MASGTCWLLSLWATLLATHLLLWQERCSSAPAALPSSQGSPSARLVQLQIRADHKGFVSLISCLHQKETILHAWLMPVPFMLCCWPCLQGLFHLPLVAWNLRTFLKDHHTVDVTEIFRQIHWEKKVRIVKLIMYLCLFVFVIYRLVESAVVGLLSEENKKQAGMLLQDAATATYY